MYSFTSQSFYNSRNFTSVFEMKAFATFSISGKRPMNIFKAHAEALSIPKFVIYILRGWHKTASHEHIYSVYSIVVGKTRLF